MKNKTILGLFAFALVAILGISMVSAYNGFGLMNHDFSKEDKAEMQEQRIAMRTAIENQDFESWESLMEEKIARMQERLTEGNFNELVERHSKMGEQRESHQEMRDTMHTRESGDFEGIKHLKEKSGFFHRMKNKFFGN